MIDKSFIYARKSSEDKSRQIQSINDQLRELRKIINERDDIPPVVGEPFTEEKTAKISGVRVKFYEMLRRIESGEANTILVWKADRLARNGGDGGKIIEMVDNGIVKKIITPTNIFDKQNSFMLWVEFMSSTKVSKDISDGAKRGLKTKVEKGDYPNQAPLGYRNTPNLLKGTRKIEVDNKRWDLCRKWWELMITGLYSVEKSLEEINKMGLTGKKGNPISRTVAYKFFRDIFYTGNFEYSGVVSPGNHKPMVTMAEWVKVQQILDIKSKRRMDSQDFAYEKTFQGMLKCGECGASITLEKHLKHYKNGTSQIFWYYRCTKKCGSCSQPYLDARYFDLQIKGYISRLELNPMFGSWIKKVLKRRNIQEFNFERKQQEIKTKKLSALTDQKEKLYGMKIEGLYSEEEYQAKKKCLLIEETHLRESLQKPQTSYWESVIENTIDFASAVSNLFENGDIYTRQLVLRILGSNLILKDKRVEIEAKKAFVFLKDAQNGISKENLWLEPNKIPELRPDMAFVFKKSSTVPRRGLEPPRIY